jgi:hypothetical protein
MNKSVPRSNGRLRIRAIPVVETSRIFPNQAVSDSSVAVIGSPRISLDMRTQARRSILGFLLNAIGRRGVFCSAMNLFLFQV